MSELRRFRLVNSKNEKKLNVLIDKKNITRDDLILILSTLELREKYKI